MADASAAFEGRRLLIVEDDYFIATDLAHAAQELGLEVIGPAGSVADALRLIQANELHGAVLDIHLGRERVFPVADALSARGVPFIFVTGYDPVDIPEAYAATPRCEKPVDKGLLARVLRTVGVV